MHGSKRRLTKEKEELRLSELRILARLIVRAYLSSLIHDAAPGVPPARSPLRKDGGHVR